MLYNSHQSKCTNLMFPLKSQTKKESTNDSNDSYCEDDDDDYEDENLNGNMSEELLDLEDIGDMFGKPFKNTSEVCFKV